MSDRDVACPILVRYKMLTDDEVSLSVFIASDRIRHCRATVIVDWILYLVNEPPGRRTVSTGDSVLASFF